MTAVDTNIIVRLFTEDDPVQAAVVRSLFKSGPLWIAKTVLLETAWVLKSLYGHSPEKIREAFISLLGLPNVHTEDEAGIRAALNLNAQGVDLADAIHLASRPANVEFVSFDKAFVRKAKLAGVAKISVP